MKKKNKSMKEKLKVNSFQRQEKVLTEWASGWEKDQTDILKKLRWAAQNDDHGEIMHMIDQLDGMARRRFTALGNVIKIVSDPERNLDDNGDQEEKLVEEIVPAATAENFPVPEAQPGPPRTGLDVEEITKCYNAGMPLKEIADYNKMAYDKVIKILVTEGVYTSEVYDKIKYYREIGKTENEISDLMGLGKSAMNRYTPYRKGAYKSESATQNALRIRKLREKRKE